MFAARGCVARRVSVGVGRSVGPHGHATSIVRSRAHVQSVAVVPRRFASSSAVLDGVDERSPHSHPRAVRGGLYDRSTEHDACGTGFIADLTGKKTHTTVMQGLEAVERLDHRGAAAADALSGDGVGILTQVPHLFFKKKLAARGIDLDHPRDLGVGVMFMPPPAGSAENTEARRLCEVAVEEAGMRVLAWRRVPVGTHALGAASLETLPDIQQLLLHRPPSDVLRKYFTPAARANVARQLARSPQAGQAALQIAEDDAFERVLYLVRRRIENRVAAAGIKDLYIPSMSHRQMVYKGLVVAANLRHLFPDLNDSDFQSSIALFHQRYSTNTFPMWSTAQPFRMLGHNGEINTVQGNRAWMQMREETLRSDAFGDEFADLLPVIRDAGGSDSAELDNVLELLVQCGRSPLAALSMMVPEAHEGDRTMDPALRAYYDYARTLMEPWDGPAALCVTDGRVAAATMDRNGLRPLRYWVTSAGKVICGSEVGIVDVPVEKVLHRGRLGPGDMLAANSETGELLRDSTIKKRLASRRPYRAWIDRSVAAVGSGTVGLNQVLTYDTMLAVLGDARVVAMHGEDAPEAAQKAVNDRQRVKKAFGYAREDEELVLMAMANTAHEPIGSMGDDAPIAAFSSKPQPVTRYLKQRFAEVTNPPIDPLLERERMSLSITFGRKGMLLEESQHASFLMRFDTPVITESQLKWLSSHPEFVSKVLPSTFDVAVDADGAVTGDLQAGIDALCTAAEAAVDAGASLLVLSDRSVDAEHAPIPAVLAVGAVHHHLIQQGKRMQASIICESGEPREDHHIAALIGYGASLVNPYLAFETVAELVGKANMPSPPPSSKAKGSKKQKKRAGRTRAARNAAVAGTGKAATSVEKALANYRTALSDGLLRIMSKMGISTIDSYRGAQTFEAIGLGNDVVDKCLKGTPVRLPGASFDAIGADVLAHHNAAYREDIVYKRGTALTRSGVYRPVKGGEYHAYNPLVFNSLRASSTREHVALEDTTSKPGAPGSGDAAPALEDVYPSFAAFVAHTDSRPITSVRDVLDFKRRADGPIPLAEVESVESIVKRFTTQAMSHGSISREAHEALSHAAHLLGSRSNTGEGGEDSERFAPYTRDVTAAPTDDPDAVWYADHWTPKAGSRGGSKIKQVASARFGVTPHYLASAEQLEIKMAQGSKPGEGGHIPGHKVNSEIARNRHSPQGVTLISPPPHHDIYSIEDLAQLVYDLKRVNSEAPVSVKLVAQSGVGTIAAGCVKARADILQISGNDGGTGASPLSSIKNVGLPWELGLAEAQQVLVANGLRERVTLRVDGGMKTGRDVVMAALLGGEEFGFGTAALVALGCVMDRSCHLNTCPVGIATQDPELRAKFKGSPEDVVTYLIHTAEGARHIMAEMGVRTIDELVGRTDLLRVKSIYAGDAAGDRPTVAHTPKGKVDLSAMLVPPVAGAAIKSADRGQRCDPDARPAPLFGSSVGSDVNLDDIVWRTAQPFVDSLVEGTLDGNSDHLDLHFPITNASRSVGARLSGEIARRFGDRGLLHKDGVVAGPFRHDNLADAVAAASGSSPVTSERSGPSIKDLVTRGGLVTGTTTFAPAGGIKVQFHGVAGQSFGAFNNAGVELVLRGEALDFVGKGMYGGNLVLTPPADVTRRGALVSGDGTSVPRADEDAPIAAASEARAARGVDGGNIIMGNACLYGATGGLLFADGVAGERFAVRNSGATAVILGGGDHMCEYMTAGTVVSLGEVGRNFGAGMSGGSAFVFDPKDRFTDQINMGMVQPRRLEVDEPETAKLRTLVETFVLATSSPTGRQVLDHWDEVLPLFWFVQPNTDVDPESSQAVIHVPQWARAEGRMASALREQRYLPGDIWSTAVRDVDGELVSFKFEADDLA